MHTKPETPPENFKTAWLLRVGPHARQLVDLGVQLLVEGLVVHIQKLFLDLGARIGGAGSGTLGLRRRMWVTETGLGFRVCKSSAHDVGASGQGRGFRIRALAWLRAGSGFGVFMKVVAGLHWRPYSAAAQCSRANFWAVSFRTLGGRHRPSYP